jgi:hypothetical protein
MRRIAAADRTRARDRRIVTMSLLGIIYFVVGLAIGLWTILRPTMGTGLNIRSDVRFAYVFIPVVVHSLWNDPFVALGILVIPLSFAIASLRTGARSFGVIYVALTGIWAVWVAMLFAHRQTEVLFSWFLVASLIIWIAQIVVFARSHGEVGNVD